MFKKKKQPEPPEAPEPKSYNIHLETDQFMQYIVDFETGKIDSQDILILMCYLDERIEEISERYYYPYLLELMDYGVLKEGLVNPQKLNEFKGR